VQRNALCIALLFQLYLFLFNHTLIIDVIAFVKNDVFNSSLALGCGNKGIIL